MKKLLILLILCFMGITFGIDLSMYKYLIPAYWRSYDLNKKLEQIHNSIVIVNPSNGDFVKSEDVFRDQINKSHNGWNLAIWYIYTKYGQRDINEVKSRIDSRLKNYPNIDGFFFDEVSDSKYRVPYYEELYKYVKAKNSRLIVILNPWTTPDEKYFRISDNIVVYENPCSDYENYKQPDRLKKYPNYKISYLGYNCSDDQYKSLVAKYGKYIFYFTDDGADWNPWDSLSKYLLFNVSNQNNKEKLPPYNFNKFKKFLDNSKLTYPTSHDKVVDYGKFDNFKSDWFYADKDWNLHFVLEKKWSNKKIRNELRRSPNPPKNDGFDVNDDKIWHLYAKVKLQSIKRLKEYTFLQIHSEKHSLLRVVVEKFKKWKRNHIWAVVRITTKDSWKRTQRYDLWWFTNDFIDFDIYIWNWSLKIKRNGKVYVDKDISRWPEKKNYFKAGIYDSKNSKGEWKVEILFNKLSRDVKSVDDESFLINVDQNSKNDNYYNNIVYWLWVWRPSFSNKVNGKPAWHLLYDDKKVQKILIDFVKKQNIKRIFLYIGSIQREWDQYFKNKRLYNERWLVHLLKELKDNDIEIYWLFYINDNPNDLSNYERVKDLVKAVANYNRHYPEASFDWLQIDQEPYKIGIYPKFLNFLKLTYSLCKSNNLKVQLATKPLWVTQKYHNKPFVDILSKYVDELVLMDYYDDLWKIKELANNMKWKVFSIWLETSYINVGSSNTFYDDIKSKWVEWFKENILLDLEQYCKKVSFCKWINIHNFTAWYYLNYNKEPYKANFSGNVISVKPFDKEKQKKDNNLNLKEKSINRKNNKNKNNKKEYKLFGNNYKKERLDDKKKSERSKFRKGSTFGKQKRVINVKSQFIKSNNKCMITKSFKKKVRDIFRYLNHKIKDKKVLLMIYWWLMDRINYLLRNKSEYLYSVRCKLLYLKKEADKQIKVLNSK